MILLIDNYDSFTYNVYHQLANLHREVQVVRNDGMTIEEIQTLHPSAIVLSPGPGNPLEAGITVQVVKELYKEFPILGICLGHQTIGEAFDCNIVRAKQIMHGKTSTVIYKPKGLFEHVTGDIEVMRYHSLVIDPSTLHPDLEVIATSKDDGEIMAIQHKRYPVYGLQFHPESIGTGIGTSLIEAFFKKVNSQY